MRDPWTVLGVSQNADEEEIKKAYRALVKKYHPDRFATSPKATQDEAAERMREINEAYEFLIKKGGTQADWQAQEASQNASSSYSGGYGYSSGNNSYSEWANRNSYSSGNHSYSSGNNSYSSGNNSYSEWANRNSSGNNYGSGSQQQANFGYIRRMIQENQLQAAEQLLDNMAARPAEWYFLRGLCYLRRGWYSQAKDCVDQAVSMDPNNVEYRSVQNQILQNLNQYRAESRRQQAASTVEDACCCLGNCCLCSSCCCDCMDCCDCC